MKNPYEILARFAPQPTAEDIAAAQKLGVTIGEYQAVKLEVMMEEAKKQLPSDNRPADIVREELIATRLRREPGLIKPRNTAPNLLVQATETPGELAKTVLFVASYLAGLAAFVILGGEKARNMPGILQCILLGLMVIPVMWITNRLWEAIGEGARDVCRALVRFWPLTLVALLFALGALKMLVGRAT